MQSVFGRKWDDAFASHEDDKVLPSPLKRVLNIIRNKYL